MSRSNGRAPVAEWVLRHRIAIRRHPGPFIAIAIFVGLLAAMVLLSTFGPL